MDTSGLHGASERVAMIKVEKSIVIDRSQEDVCEYVSDDTNAPRWQRGLLEVRRATEGPIGVGTRHTLVRMFMGRRMGASNEFTQYEPNRLVSFKVTSGSVAAQGWYVVEPAGSDRARLTSRIEMRPSGLIRLAQALMAASLGREGEAHLRCLTGWLASKVEERSGPGQGP